MTTVAVISSIYGGYDHFPEVPLQDIPAEWVMVTGQPAGCPPPWTVVYEPRPHLGPSFASKVARARPDLYSDADVLIWMDGNVVIRDSTFITWCLDLLSDADLAAIDTTQRRAGILEEAQIASRIPRYAGQPVIAQAEHYLAEGFPDTARWWTGVMVRRRGCPDFGSPWLAEMARWGCECQISLPYILWKMGIKPAGTQEGPTCITTRAHAIW